MNKLVIHQLKCAKCGEKAFFISHNIRCGGLIMSGCCESYFDIVKTWSYTDERLIELLDSENKNKE